MILIKNYRGRLSTVLGALFGRPGVWPAGLYILESHKLLGTAYEKTPKQKCSQKRTCKSHVPRVTHLLLLKAGLWFWGGWYSSSVHGAPTALGGRCLQSAWQRWWLGWSGVPETAWNFGVFFVLITGVWAGGVRWGLCSLWELFSEYFLWPDRRVFWN